MLKAGRLVVALMSLYMAFGLIWTGASFPLMGVDQELFGVGARPPELLGQPWPTEKMQDWAHEYDVDVLTQGSPQMPGLVAGFPASEESEFATWLRDGYPCLNSCVVQPLNLELSPEAIAQFEMNVSGLYFMGERSEEAAQEAVAYFQSIGWETGYAALDSQEYWVGLFRTLFDRLFVITAVIVLLLAGGSVLVRSRSNGVLLLQGSSRGELVLADILIWLKLALSGAGLGLVALFGVFLVAFKGKQFDRIALAAVPIVITLALVGVLGIALAHQILRATRILGMVKGQTKFGLALPLIYLLRSSLVLVMVALLVTLSTSINSYREQQEMKGKLGAMASQSLVMFNSGSGDNQEGREKAASEAANMFANGDLILNQAQPAYYFDASQSIRHELQSGDQSLVIEATVGFFKVNQMTLSNGRRFDVDRDMNPSEVALLVPEGADQRVVDSVVEYVRNSFGEDGVGMILGAEVDVAPKVMSIQNNQQGYLTYSGDITSAQNPIVIVYPKGFSPSSGFITSLSGLFIDSTKVSMMHEVAPHFASLIVDPMPVSEVVSDALDENMIAVNQGVIELVGVLLALPLCTLAGAFLYIRQNAKRVFIQTISGHRLFEIMPMLVLVDAITVVATCWYLRPTVPDLGDLHSYGQLALVGPTIQFSLAIGVLVLMIAMQIGILKKLQWNVVHRHAAEE